MARNRMYKSLHAFHNMRPETGIKPAPVSSPKLPRPLVHPASLGPPPIPPWSEVGPSRRHSVKRMQEQVVPFAAPLVRVTSPSHRPGGSPF